VVLRDYITFIWVMIEMKELKDGVYLIKGYKEIEYHKLLDFYHFDGEDHWNWEHGIPQFIYEKYKDRDVYLIKPYSGGNHFDVLVFEADEVIELTTNQYECIGYIFKHEVEKGMLIIALEND